MAGRYLRTAPLLIIIIVVSFTTAIIYYWPLVIFLIAMATDDGVLYSLRMRGVSTPTFADRKCDQLFPLSSFIPSTL